MNIDSSIKTEVSAGQFEKRGRINMNSKIFSVLDYGAKANLDKVQTEAFQKALDECFLSGGGEVVVPEGTYIIGDIRIRSNTVFHLMENAVLLGSRNPQDYFHINNDTIEPLPEKENTMARWYYPQEWIAMGGGFKKHLYTAGSRWNYGLIRAVYAENIAIIGEKGSKIDGRNVYDPDGEENYRGPHAINMHFCKNVKFEGYTIENASNWAHFVCRSENIVFNNLTVLAGHDALHTRACSNVLIDSCTLITGDDAVAGFDNLDVVIRNCEISSACSAFRYGGNNILVENCNVYGPCKYQFRGSFTPEEKAVGAVVSENGRNNMLSFWTNFVTDDLPVRKPAGNICIRNCTVKNADRMLHLNLSGNEPWQRGTPPTDISFENIRIENVKMGLVAYGIENSPMVLNLKNIEYSFCEGYEETPLMRVAYCDEINFDNVKISNYKGKSLIRTWSNNVKVNTKDFDCDLNGGELLVSADEEFVCQKI